MDGQQVSEQFHRAADKMPGDGFTIKNRIRNLLRSPSAKYNKKENLTSKVFILKLYFQSETGLLYLNVDIIDPNVTETWI